MIGKESLHSGAYLSGAIRSQNESGGRRQAVGRGVDLCCHQLDQITWAFHGWVCPHLNKVHGSCHAQRELKCLEDK